MAKPKFRCTRCKYEFFLLPGKNDPPNVCPYCGRKNTVDFKKHILEEI